MSWPKEVPVLTEKDIYRGAMYGPRGKCCLIGWVAREFPWSEKREVISVLKFVLAKRAKKSSSSEQLAAQSIVRFNDNPDVPKEEIAKVWNQAMATLGYTEGNPEKPFKVGK